MATVESLYRRTATSTAPRRDGGQPLLYGEKKENRTVRSARGLGQTRIAGLAPRFRYRYVVHFHV